MKCIAIITGLLAVGAFGAPVSAPASDLDSFDYTNNIDNAVVANDVDSFDYTNNIDNAVVANDADSFDYTNNIDNAVVANDAKPDSFNYHDNAVTVDADGTKVVLSSPYTDDVKAADPAKVLGE